MRQVVRKGRRMATSRSTGQICQKCREKNPKKAKFCMKCGFNMKSQSNRLWHGVVLYPNKGFDPKLVLDRISEVIEPQYINFDPKKVTEDDIREVLGEMTPKRQQLVIRWSGIGRWKAISVSEIAKETGSKTQSVRQTLNRALFEIALYLRVVKPNASTKRRQERFSQSVRQLVKEVRQSYQT